MTISTGASIAQLRVAIATALGVTITREDYRDGMGFLPCNALGTKVFVVRTPEGRIGHSQMSVGYALDDTGVPDWPLDAGAALALCLKIARGRGGWLYCEPSDYWEIGSNTSAPLVGVEMTTEYTDARALSELALAVMRAREE